MGNHNNHDIDTLYDLIHKMAALQQAPMPLLPPKKESKASTRALFFTLALLAGTWIVIVISWFLTQEYPQGLVNFTWGLKGLAFGETGFICIEKCYKYKNENGNGGV